MPQERKLNLDVKGLESKLREYSVILKLTRRPTREEFLRISKIAGAVILIIGLIGFLIYVFLTVLPESI
ncbi:protein translocase SEC61 complex subunit gamma [Candidatus Alkanophaga liquidiphilum]|nr:MAG: protein translocase SEC61 complex subunit gamma [Candidatus Alkanophagales archaeon]